MDPRHISTIGQINEGVLKSERKRMQKEAELEQQRKNQVDYKNESYNGANVDLAFDQTMTMGQFLDTVTTHLEHRTKEHKSNRDKTRKKQKITIFLTKMSSLQENEEEYKNSHLHLDKEGHEDEEAELEITTTAERKKRKKRSGIMQNTMKARGSRMQKWRSSKEMKS